MPIAPLMSLAPVHVESLTPLPPRLEPVNAARVLVCQKVDEAVRPRADVANPARSTLQELLLAQDAARLVEVEAAHEPIFQRAHQEVALPTREPVAKIKGKPRWRDRGVPVVGGLLDPRGALWPVPIDVPS